MSSALSPERTLEPFDTTTGQAATPKLCARILAALFGDERPDPLEQRLCNTISLLNGVTNLGGALSMLLFANYKFLLLLHLGTGALFLVFYYLARNLNQERRKSDRLLLNILPEMIAQELKTHDRVVPLDYERASVLFTDFVGFTRIAEHLTPQALLEELDGSFREFDRIARRHKLEKIKTIGDAYMAVGGIPRANETHAVDCVLAALEIQRLMNERMARNSAAGRPYWQVRVGINTGSVVAGVIGREKFAYDVWGDTVNTASRLESSGAPDQVNISQATYEQVKDFFRCEYRGKVAAKNKGAIDMYFVRGLRPELAHTDGREPNERFFELYAQLAQAPPRIAAA